MNIVFAATHLTMAFCLIIILYMAIADSMSFNDVNLKNAFMSICTTLKLKYLKTVNGNFLRKATAYFIVLTQLNSNN